MTADDRISAMQESIRTAGQSGEPLFITGSGSKRFRLPPWEGQTLDTRSLDGIVDYQPTELVVTVRAGMPVGDLQQALAAAGQMLGFEPPAEGCATIGGTVACGLSGPRRPYAGAVRDFVLGVRCLNGRGEDLHFGGRVIKNVAGYDIARLMVGAWGTLGALLEISLKVLPLPECERTFCQRLTAAEAITTMNRLAMRPLPLSAAAWLADVLYVRFSGATTAVAAAGRETGLVPVADGGALWEALREQRLDFFAAPEPLWRLSMPSTAAMVEVAGDWLIDWGGAQRWLRTTSTAEEVHRAAARAGGYASLYRGPEQGSRSQPALSPALLTLQQRLKSAFDPAGILNPGLLYTAASC